MRVTAKVDYALRAMAELASATQPAGPEFMATEFVKAEAIAEHQGVPLRFLLNILGDLRAAQLVVSRRGAEGGYAIARPPSQISAADVIRAVEGPLADVHGTPPERLAFPQPASALRQVWIATRAALREILEVVTLEDVVTGQLPESVSAQLNRPGALERR